VAVERRERRSVSCGVLAQVEGEQVEAEHPSLDLEVGDAAVGDGPGADGPQRRAQDPRSATSSWDGVPLGDGATVGPPGAAGVPFGGQQLLVDEREELPVRLLGVAAVDVRAARVGVAQGTQALVELGGGATPLAHREVGVHPVDGASQQADRQDLVLAPGRLGHRRRDVGVAVPVATDPGPERRKRTPRSGPGASG
jgi:hypothetical protein